MIMDSEPANMSVRGVYSLEKRRLKMKIAKIRKMSSVRCSGSLNNVKRQPVGVFTARKSPWYLLESVYPHHSKNLMQDSNISERNWRNWFKKSRLQ